MIHAWINYICHFINDACLNQLHLSFHKWYLLESVTFILDHANSHWPLLPFDPWWPHFSRSLHGIPMYPMCGWLLLPHAGHGDPCWPLWSGILLSTICQHISARSRWVCIKWQPFCNVGEKIVVLLLADFFLCFNCQQGIVGSVNSLWPSDAIWQHKSRSTLAQVMACCLMVPSHYLNQCWLIISKIQWHPSESNFTRDTSAISH